MKGFSLSDSFPYVLVFATCNVALAHLINSTSIVSVYCTRRERFVKLFGALKTYSLGRLFSWFKVIMNWHLFVLFLLCLFLFSVLCPLPFYLRGCHQTKRSTFFLTLLQVPDTGRRRWKIFLSFFFFPHFRPQLFCML